MNNKKLHVLSLIGAGITASCGYTAPYETSGPALSKEGVQITVAGEQCYLNRSTEEFPTTVDDGVLHVGLKLQVANHSDRPAVVSRDGFHLEETMGSAHAVMQPEQSGSVTLSPGQSTELLLDFTHASEMGLDCHQDLALNAGGAVAIEGRPTTLASIRFQPAR
jgi:hypothetical protein